MSDEPAASSKDILDHQRPHWDTTFAQKPDVFGRVPSEPALKAAVFRRESKTDLLELGGGQGRDTVFFAREGFQVTVLDYSQTAVDTLAAKAAATGLTNRITARRHDVREPLPFDNDIFDPEYLDRLWLRDFPRAKVLRLEDAGHYLQEDAHERIVPALVNFLRRN